MVIAIATRHTTGCPAIMIDCSNFYELERGHADSHLVKLPQFELFFGFS